MAPYIPLAPTGRAEDLLGIVVRAEQTRYARAGVVVPDKPAWARACLEPIGNLLGLLLQGLARLLPNPALAALQQACLRRLASPNVFPFASEHPRLAEAKRLVDSLTSAGKRPALFCAFTHPPVRGPWLHLNVELTRQALRALGWLRPRSSRPKLVLAIDAFALDGFDLFTEGVYAGLAGGLHFGFDRLASHRSAASRALVGFTAWPRIVWRLSGRLAEGGEVGIPLGGGVATTSRALYSAREFVWRLRRRRLAGRVPAEVLRALAAAEADFAAFARSAPVGAALRKSAWRMSEAWLMALLSGAWGADAQSDAGPSCDRGCLSPVARSAAVALGRAMGLPEPEALAAAEELDRELARQTPYRTRLLRVLARRVAARGRALVLLPLAHGCPPDVKMEWGEPVALVGACGEEVTVARADGSATPASLARFAHEFVAKNLP